VGFGISKKENPQISTCEEFEDLEDIGEMKFYQSI
jgi:hypothetical protein